MSHLRLKVESALAPTENIRALTLVSEDGRKLPGDSAGSHIKVRLPDGGERHYSLINADPGVDPSSGVHAYRLGVLKEPAGKGGSLFMHGLTSGDTIEAVPPKNDFPVREHEAPALLIAGGIGITPFLSQIGQLSAQNGHFELHYCVRSAALASYEDELLASHKGRVHVYHDDRGEQIDLAALLEGQPLGTHLYVCGPKGMIGWVRDTAAELAWPGEAVHYEEFLAPASGKPFEVLLARSNKRVVVGEHQSLLEAIEAAGVEAPYLCRGGACGQCETDVLEHEGMFLHKDHWLTQEQHAGGKKIMPCVSRFEGGRLVLDR